MHHKVTGRNVFGQVPRLPSLYHPMPTAQLILCAGGSWTVSDTLLASQNLPHFRPRRLGCRGRCGSVLGKAWDLLSNGGWHLYGLVFNRGPTVQFAGQICPFLALPRPRGPRSLGSARPRRRRRAQAGTGARPGPRGARAGSGGLGRPQLPAEPARERQRPQRRPRCRRAPGRSAAAPAPASPCRGAGRGGAGRAGPGQLPARSAAPSFLPRALPRQPGRSSPRCSPARGGGRSSA